MSLKSKNAKLLIIKIFLSYRKLNEIEYCQEIEFFPPVIT